MLCCIFHALSSCEELKIGQSQCKCGTLYGERCMSVRNYFVAVDCYGITSRHWLATVRPCHANMSIAL